MEEGRDEHGEQEGSEAALGDVHDESLVEHDLIGTSIGELAWDRGCTEKVALECQAAFREGFLEEHGHVREDECEGYYREPAGGIRIRDRDQRGHCAEYREEGMRDDLRRVALFGSGVAELTRHRAEALARDLIERSKENRSEFLRIIRDEISNQLESLGVATKRDVERLERRVARMEASSKKSTTSKKKTSSGRKTSATKSDR